MRPNLVQKSKPGTEPMNHRVAQHKGLARTLQCVARSREGRLELVVRLETLHQRRAQLGEAAAVGRDFRGGFRVGELQPGDQVTRRQQAALNHLEVHAAVGGH